VNRPSAGISRVDQPSHRTHGYVVRLDYRRTAQGYRPQVVAYFPDKRHGSRRAAWAAAEQYAAKARRSLKK
jgi:hypothetical protein